MKTVVKRLKCLYIFIFAHSLLFGQTNLITPTSPVLTFGSVNSPSGEDVTKIRDGIIGTKFLDFNRNDGMGFVIDIGASYAARQLIMTTANDSRERDPSSFSIRGSNNNSTFFTIGSVGIPCVSNRFFTRTFSLNNTSSVG